MKKGIKKLFSIFLIFLLFANSAIAEEYARLYNIRDINAQRAEQIITPFLKLTGFRTISKNNFYILENPAMNIYTVLALKPNGKDCYYYFLSNEDSDLNKRILDNFDKYGFKKKRMRNKAFLTLFRSEASDFLAGNATGIKAVSNEQDIINLELPAEKEEYDFSDEAQAKFDTRTAAITPQMPLTLPQKPLIATQKQNVLKGSIVHIEAGQQFDAVLSSTISSDSIANNDRVSAQLEDNWIVNGILIAPAGSILNGSVVNSRPAQFAMGDGRIGLVFNQILTPDGKVINLTTNEVRIVGESSRALRIAGRTAGGALGGLLLGALFLIGGADPGRALASGAAIGGAFGAASAIMTKGEDVHIPEGTILQILLAEPMTAQPYIQYN